jgi:dTDP-glucose 4,6-dehydratase
MEKTYKNILVTGGSGFIGSNFIHNYLNNNPESNVHNLDKLTYAGNNNNHSQISLDDRYQFHHGDICSKDIVENILRENSIDAIVHFAAESHVDRSIEGPSEFINTNILGTFNLLQCALKHHESQNDFIFMHVSTDEVYGSLNLQDPPFSEGNQYMPNSPYSASKASSDHLVRAWYHTFGLPVVTTNCSNNYGPYQFPEKLIPLTIWNALNNLPITIYGDGKNIRDWLYVKDHCDAIECSMKNGRHGEVYNVGGINEKTNVEIVNTICEILDEYRPQELSYKTLITHTQDRLGHDFRYAIDQSKITSELGWTPAETFETGIVKTVKWYLENEAWIKDIKKV